MKICHIIPGYYPSSSPQIAYTRILSKMGHQVNVLSLQRDGEKNHEILNGINVIRLGRINSGLFLVKTAPRFIKSISMHLSQNDYDIIHIYSFRGCSLLPLINRNKSATWILDIRTGNISKSLIKSSVANTVTKIESMAFSNITVLDSMVAKKVLTPRTPYIEIPLGADFNNFRPGRDHTLRNSLGIPNCDCLLVFSSTLEPQRHPETVIDAFRLAYNEMPGLRLLIVGDGKSRTVLETMVAKFGLSDRVLFTGQVSYDDVAAYVSIADIGLGFVPITPQYNPQPPLKTVEYLASGLPVIGTRTKGNMRFIKHLNNGLLCDDNPSSIAEEVVLLSEDKELRDRLAANARDSVLQYDWCRIVEMKLLPFYQNALRREFQLKSAKQKKSF